MSFDTNPVTPQHSVIILFFIPGEGDKKKKLSLEMINGSEDGDQSESLTSSSLYDT